MCVSVYVCVHTRVRGARGCAQCGGCRIHPRLAWIFLDSTIDVADGGSRREL